MYTHAHLQWHCCDIAADVHWWVKWHTLKWVIGLLLSKLTLTSYYCMLHSVWNWTIGGWTLPVRASARNLLRRQKDESPQPDPGQSLGGVWGAGDRYGCSLYRNTMKNTKHTNTEINIIKTWLGQMFTNEDSGGLRPCSQLYHQCLADCCVERLGVQLCKPAGSRLKQKLLLQVNSALHPSRVAKSSNSFGWCEGGKVTTAGCDPTWHVISCSSVMILITNCYIRLTYMYLFTYITRS